VPPAVLTPELAVRRLGELSAEVREAVLLDGRGELAAVRGEGAAPSRSAGAASRSAGASERSARASADSATAPTTGAAGGYAAHRLAELARGLVRAADTVDEVRPWSQVEVVTSAGAVFAVRHRGWTLVAACTRDALPSLTFLDLRSVLDGLAPDATG
jgi:hypothetical protein